MASVTDSSEAWAPTLLKNRLFDGLDGLSCHGVWLELTPLQRVLLLAPHDLAVESQLAFFHRLSLLVSIPTS